MNWKRVLIVFVALALVAAGYICWRAPVLNHDVVRKVFGNQQFFEAFVTSQQITAQRLHHHESPLGSDNLNDYDQDAPVPVTFAQAQEIQRLLQRPTSYDWNTRYAKACILDYGVLLHFRSDSNSVSVALCFDCNMLGVYDTRSTNNTRLNTEWDFDPIRKQLVTAVKSVFPDDEEIQKIR